MKRKTLKILGVIFLVLLVIIGGGIGYVAIKAALDKESKAYADAAILAIITAWDKQGLMSRGSPELMMSLQKGKVDKIFAIYKRLGELEWYKGSAGQATMRFDLSQGKLIEAEYQASADFENGSAMIDVALLKKGNKWLIQGFYVNSDVFRGNIGDLLDFFDILGDERRH